MTPAGYTLPMRGTALACGFLSIIGARGCAEPEAHAPAPVHLDAAHTTEPGRSAITVSYAGKPGPVDRAAVEQWIDTATRGVTAYFGHFPVKHLELHVTFDDENGAHEGVTYDGERINVHVGRNTPPSDLAKDWMLTHEMFHLAFPSQDDDHHWMEEGLSTYLEPIARVRIGNMTTDQFWLETVQGMPQGLPERGDQGLDRTHTWGRTYWGGAMFWLLADVRIREQTQNHKSLDDVIRTILEAGGDGSVPWPAARVMQAGDAATGTKVLTELYAQLATKPTAPDLAALWKQLGVALQGDRVTFDDSAPLAAIRKSMTAPSTVIQSKMPGPSSPR